MQSKSIKAKLVDLHSRSIFPAEITISNGHIERVRKLDEELDNFILPGFIDAHIHIESSMLVPYEFARVALTHGTVATVSDPHEIANVLGVSGVDYMIENAKEARLKFHFGAPSCVPATSFETSGSSIDSDEIKNLLARDEIYYLSEMMNYPGVLNGDPEVLKKIQYAKEYGKPVDGHAPGLKGDAARIYINEGITTDHECFSLDEALGKLEHGMKIIIREGSAAKNYGALHSLIDSHPTMVMFCSDDKHPDDLLKGHMNELVKRSLKLGYDLFDVLRIACLNPIEHYGLNVGLLRESDPADFIIVDNLEEFNVLETYIDGECVAKSGSSVLEKRKHLCPNNFKVDPLKPEEFQLPSNNYEHSIIHAIDGEIVTNSSIEKMILKDGLVLPDPERDILKIAVVNRYFQSEPAIGFIKNFGIKEGAIASTVAHDSHNIIVVGSDDNYISRAVNLLVSNKGGLSAVSVDGEKLISLPVAGLMSDKSCKEIGAAYSEIDLFAKKMGSKLSAPFMTLSFMALLVIPKIKMSDKGLFDAESFSFINP